MNEVCHYLSCQTVRCVLNNMAEGQPIGLTAVSLVLFGLVTLINAQSCSTGEKSVIFNPRDINSQSCRPTIILLSYL